MPSQLEQDASIQSPPPSQQQQKGQGQDYEHDLQQEQTLILSPEAATAAATGERPPPLDLNEVGKVLSVCDSNHDSMEAMAIEAGDMSTGDFDDEGCASAAAATNDETSGDASIAQALYAVETLTQLFGFSPEVSSQAVEAVGTDVTKAYNYILDRALGQDTGGAIAPITNCPHLQRHVKLSPLQLHNFVQDPKTAPCDYFSEINKNSDNMDTNQSSCGEDTTTKKSGQAKSEIDETTGACPLGENWLCLECGVVRCSRYVNGHGLTHWEESQKYDDSKEGHCVCVSFADLSIWCHLCNAYLRHSTLDPLIERLESLKFSDDDEKEEERTLERKVKRARSNNFDAALIEKGVLAATDTNAGEKKTLPGAGSGGSDTTDAAGGATNTSAAAPPAPHNSPSPRATISNARGFPIDLNCSGGGKTDSGDQEEEEEYEELEFPFGEKLPSSLQEVADFIKSDKCRSIVVLAGAGMSVRSGIPDFRSANGLYATMDPDKLTADPVQREAMRVDPSVALEQGLFMKNPLPCLELNRSFLLGTREEKWKATLAHRFVEGLHSKLNKLVRWYTQNIDGLEDQCTKLPRDKVVNVHGSMDRAQCATCYNESDFDAFCEQVQRQIKDLSGTDPTAPATSTPIACPRCGCNTMKPGIVLFKSSLPRRFFELVPEDIAEVDLLIVIGTSLRVAPANSLIWRVPETTMRLVVNRDPVGIHLGIQYGRDSLRDYFAGGDIDATFLELMAHLGWLDEMEPLLQNHKLPESSATLLRDKLDAVKRAGATNGLK